MFQYNKKALFTYNIHCRKDERFLKIFFQNFSGPGIFEKKNPRLSMRHGNPVINFYARKQLRFQRVLAIAILSVRPSVSRVDQAKTVQARISKFSPSAAWKTLVSGTVKLSHKFEGGHPERGR